MNNIAKVSYVRADENVTLLLTREGAAGPRRRCRGLSSVRRKTNMICARHARSRLERIYILYIMYIYTIPNVYVSSSLDTIGVHQAHYHCRAEQATFFGSCIPRVYPRTYCLYSTHDRI